MAAEQNKMSTVFGDSSTFSLRTAPQDVRFSASTNQARYCWNQYNTMLKCETKYGYEAPECSQLISNVCSLCPTEWLEAWREQRAQGTFPGVVLAPNPADDDDDEE